MRSNIPIIEFTYFKPDQISSLEEIISSSDKLEAFNNRYVLISHEDHPMYNNCIIYDILYSDMKKYNDEYINNFYDKFVEKYGQSNIDKIILKDENPIRNKLYSILVFAFDKVYKCDTIEIRFWKGEEFKDFHSSISNIIYSVIDENFTILNQTNIGRFYQLIISSKTPEYNNN